MHSAQKHNHGFTLIELSIVLVIIGLIVGGVLVGRDLIKAAELRSVATEFQKYVTATNVFKDKYYALPGDMSNATTFWGQAASCPGGYNQGTTDGTTCNGNADENIVSPELFRFWQHLSNAKLIEGRYNGVTTDSGNYYLGVGPTNSPGSKINSAYWAVFYGDNTTGSNTGSMFYYLFDRAFIFGGSVGTSWNYGSILKPREAASIDTKIDDGNPGTGKVLSGISSGCNSAATGADFNATYTLTNNTTSCFLMFRF